MSLAHVPMTMLICLYAWMVWQVTSRGGCVALPLRALSPLGKTRRWQMRPPQTQRVQWVQMQRVQMQRVQMQWVQMQRVQMQWVQMQCLRQTRWVARRHASLCQRPRSYRYRWVAGRYALSLLMV